MAAILIVEPDAILARSYGQVLQKANHQVVWCKTAHQAIVAADQQKPDLVVLEPRLAEHSGVEFLYEFRSYPDWDEVPVALFSHDAPDALGLHPQTMQELGVGIYLHKPATTLARFASEVNNLLAGAGL